MSDITIELDWLMEWYDEDRPEGEKLEEWARHARKSIERAKKEFLGDPEV